MDGLLVLAATPIGNAADASARLAAELAEADIVAAEDTRRLRRLCLGMNIAPRGRVVSYHDHNESTRTDELVEALLAGSRVVLVSDAGMPSVSDPGFRLVQAAVEAGVRVTALPGPSAVLTALALSALPVDRFVFEGFLPRRAGERSARLALLADEPRTMVFFESPHRVAGTLRVMASVFGPDRAGAVCRELTKTYEEVVRGPLEHLASWAEDGVRGEVTVVVAGVPANGSSASAADPGELAAAVARREAAGEHRKAAITAVARLAGLPRRTVFEAVVASRHTG